MSKFQVVEHPLIQHKLSILRRKEASTKEFRELVDEIGMLMAYEVSRDLPLEDVEIETPVQKTTVKQIAGKISSTTAAPRIIEPARVLSLPYSCKTSTVIDTEVAAKTIP